MKIMHPEKATDLVSVSDFYGYQFDVIVSAIEQANVSHKIEFFIYKSKEAFRVLVSPDNLARARDICIAIEKSTSTYDEVIALAKYNFYKLQIPTN